MQKVIEKIFIIIKPIVIGIVIILGMGFILLAGIFVLFIVATHVGDWQTRLEGHVKWNDPCFKKYSVSKGPAYQIQDDLVCMEFERGVTRAYTKTLEGADAKTFREISIFYFADKNHVYYGSKIIPGANPVNFKRIGKYGIYYEDGENVYCDGKKISMDLDTMQMINNESGYPGEYAKDKNHLWKGCEVVK